MTRFILKRIASALLVLIAISIIVFLIFYATPGVDPVARLAGKNATPEILARVRAEFGLDQPLVVQYFLMMKKLLITQELTSFLDRGVFVVPQIIRAAPITLSLVAGAAVIWMSISIVLGTIAGRFRGTVLDPLIMVIGILGISLPVFWLGQMVNLITQGSLHATVFRWVPPVGYTPMSEGIGAWALSLLFPWLTLAAMYIGIYSRVLRSEIVATDNERFVLTARAKGMSETRVLLKHNLRVSMTPLIALFGMDFGVLIGGAALLVEVVFDLPGLGRLTYDALRTFDLPILMGTVLYTAFFVVLTSMVIDIIQGRLDPRVRAS
ncbi:ABC transporter permease [Leucobacter salsicius]|uniref:ABC transporter permease n=1 Tax=Leucobacter salsicius TaxID=664638 RepID=UPI00034700F3|nr:ABC transporter permease [Leucobacter salsicius]